MRFPHRCRSTCCPAPRPYWTCAWSAWTGTTPSPSRWSTAWSGRPAGCWCACRWCGWARRALAFRRCSYWATSTRRWTVYRTAPCARTSVTRYTRRWARSTYRWPSWSPCTTRSSGPPARSCWRSVGRRATWRTATVTWRSASRTASARSSRKSPPPRRRNAANTITGPAAAPAPSPPWVFIYKT